MIHQTRAEDKDDGKIGTNATSYRGGMVIYGLWEIAFLCEGVENYFEMSSSLTGQEKKLKIFHIQDRLKILSE